MTVIYLFSVSMQHPFDVPIPFPPPLQALTFSYVVRTYTKGDWQNADWVHSHENHGTRIRLYMQGNLRTVVQKYKGVNRLYHVNRWFRGKVFRCHSSLTFIDFQPHQLRLKLRAIADPRELFSQENIGFDWPWRGSSREIGEKLEWRWLGCVY